MLKDEASLLLTNWWVCRVDVKVVNYARGVDAQHVSYHPCEDASVHMEELHQASSGLLSLLTPDICHSGGVSWV